MEYSETMNINDYEIATCNKINEDITFLTVRNGNNNLITELISLESSVHGDNQS